MYWNRSSKITKGLEHLMRNLKRTHGFYRKAQIIKLNNDFNGNPIANSRPFFVLRHENFLVMHSL